MWRDKVDNKFNKKFYSNGEVLLKFRLCWWTCELLISIKNHDANWLAAFESKTIQFNSIQFNSDTTYKKKVIISRMIEIKNVGTLWERAVFQIGK
jgi:hypothetical protein